jgi:hypothetical protein
MFTNFFFLIKMAFPAGHPSPFGPFSLLQAPWLDPAYFNLSNLTQFGQFGTSMGNFANLPCPPPWDHHHMRRVTDPLALIKGIFSFSFYFFILFYFQVSLDFSLGGCVSQFPSLVGEIFHFGQNKVDRHFSGRHLWPW